MPNWVHNHMTISGDKNLLVEVQTILGKEYKKIDNGDVNFFNLVAPPEENWDEYNSVGVPGLSPEEKANHPTFNWYDWNCNNWGTKWNACEPSADMIGNNLEVSFDTAWSHPTGFVNALVSLLGRLGLTMYYTWEEEQGFGETWNFDKNGLELKDSWDIPSSHADFEKRDKDCYCEIWEDDKDYWFDDCPKKESDKNETVSV